MAPDIRRAMLLMAEKAAQDACLSKAAYRGALASGAKAAATRAQEKFRRERERAAHWLERAGLGEKAADCRKAK